MRRTKNQLVPESNASFFEGQLAQGMDEAAMSHSWQSAATATHYPVRPMMPQRTAETVGATSWGAPSSSIFSVGGILKAGVFAGVGAFAWAAGTGDALVGASTAEALPLLVAFAIVLVMLDRAVTGLQAALSLLLLAFGYWRRNRKAARLYR